MPHAKNIKIVTFAVILTLFSGSCKKDTLEPELECKAISQLGEWYTGKWVWHHTTMNTPDSSYQLNPSNSYEYYFTISEDKVYRGYKDGILVDNFLISRDSYMSLSPTSEFLTIFEDCTNEHFRLIPGMTMGGTLANSGSNTKYPIDVYYTDSSGTTISYYNIFTKVE